MSAPCPVFGFVVHATLHEGSPDDAADDLRNDFIEMLESNGLMTGGGGHRTLEFVVNREGGQATNADRELVAAWAARWTRVATIAVSDLTDLSEVA
jgi:uncharacterized protein YggL (DUF469 family)